MMKLFLIFIVFSYGGTYIDGLKDNHNTNTRDVPTVIRAKGYPCEEHHVTTEDNYILTLHRIPHGKTSKWDLKKRTPVFLQHGLLSSSASWTLDLPVETPAFIFGDHGYDVWMGNARGNMYSRRNTKLNATEKSFWNFSFDEMAYYDIPASIDYILNITGYKQLYYIGHSMGTTMFFAGMSRRPEYNDKIKQMFGLAPVATVSHLKFPVGFFCYFNKELQEAFEVAGQYSILTENSRALEVVQKFCDKMVLTRVACEISLFSLVGFDWMEFEEEWMPVVLQELSSGTSIYTLLHYAQEHESGKFQRFDYYGRNIEIYGQSTPPLYNMSLITAPITLFSSPNDFLAPPKDVLFLSENLPNIKENWIVNDTKFNHLDFLWSVDQYFFIYKPILKSMGQISPLDFN